MSRVLRMSTYGELHLSDANKPFRPYSQCHHTVPAKTYLKSCIEIAITAVFIFEIQEDLVDDTPTHA